MTSRFVPRAAAVLVAAAALSVAVVAGHARALGASLRARAVEAGAASPDAAERAALPSDDGPFAPFAFAVVGPPRGDAASLACAVESLAARGGLAFVVVQGDLTRDGTETEALRLAASIRDRGVEVVALPGAADLASGRRAFVHAHLGGARWWFVHRGCVVLGLQGDAGDEEFLARQRPPADPRPRATIAVTAADATPGAPRVAPDAVVLGPADGIRIVRVSDDARVTVEPFTAPRGPTLRTVVRDVSLGTLLPVVETLPGYAAVLAAAALSLAVAVLRVFGCAAAEVRSRAVA